MGHLSTIKILLGATTLRAQEVYKLLLFRFGWFLALFVILCYFAHPPSTIINPASIMLYSIIIMLSRSSMVLKNAYYVFYSNQAICLAACWMLYFLGKILTINYVQPLNTLGILESLKVASFTIWSPITLFLIFTIYNIPLLWIYFLLDEKITRQTLPYLPIRSITTTMRCLWQSISIVWYLLLLWTLFDILLIYVLVVASSYSRFSNILQFLFMLLKFSLNSSFAAVLYEEIRYRATI